jgi:hypothetical protein
MAKKLTQAGLRIADTDREGLAALSETLGTSRAGVVRLLIRTAVRRLEASGDPLGLEKTPARPGQGECHNAKISDD